MPTFAAAPCQVRVAMVLASSGASLSSSSQSSSFRRVCSDTTPSIAVLIEVATGAVLGFES
jgi:hypothetical protein